MDYDTPDYSPQDDRAIERSMTLGTVSRTIALDLLQAVLRKKQPLDDSMEKHPAIDTLDKRDRGFVHMLVATTLRRLGQCDAAIKACLDKPQELKADVHDILRLGAAQIIFLGTPPHAAVDTMVELAASKNNTQPFKGLINAVLRRLSREGKAITAKQDAAKLNTPDWLWLSWRQTYGVAVARNIAEANLHEAPVDITVKTTPDLWAKKLDSTLLPTGSIRLKGDVAVTDVYGFKEGGWWVQDAASAIPVNLFGDLHGEQVFDLCAAPGGKTMQLASAGAVVLSVDRSGNRLTRLHENLKRCRLGANVIEKDVLEFNPERKAKFILLDAPCSATGTIRRHPDIPYLKTLDDVRRLADLQRRLINHVLEKLLAPGGTLIYSVCSIQPEETVEQIEGALRRKTMLERLPIKPAEVGGCNEFITSAGDLRCLPSHWADSDGIDGFYAARLKMG